MTGWLFLSCIVKGPPHRSVSQEANERERRTLCPAPALAAAALVFRGRERHCACAGVSVPWRFLWSFLGWGLEAGRWGQLLRRSPLPAHPGPGGQRPGRESLFCKRKDPPAETPVFGGSCLQKLRGDASRLRLQSAVPRAGGRDTGQEGNSRTEQWEGNYKECRASVQQIKASGAERTLWLARSELLDGGG